MTEEERRSLREDVGLSDREIWLIENPIPFDLWSCPSCAFVKVAVRTNFDVPVKCPVCGYDEREREKLLKFDKETQSLVHAPWSEDSA